jgi:hypothetical protein
MDFTTEHREDGVLGLNLADIPLARGKLRPSRLLQERAPP